MTVQVAFLLFVPILLIFDICAIVIGSRGDTKLHKYARNIGMMAFCAFFSLVASMLDSISQVWVMRPGNESGLFYKTSGGVFLVISLGAIFITWKIRVAAKN